MSRPDAPDRLSLVVFSGSFEKAHYALVMASAALSVGTPVTLFYTMGAARALLAEGGWQQLPTEDGTADAATLDARFRERGVAGYEELLAAVVALEGRVLVCEMGLRALGLERAALRADVPVETGGVVTFLNDASRDGGMLFI